MRHEAEARLEWSEERLRNEEVEIAGVNTIFK